MAPDQIQVPSVVDTLDRALSDLAQARAYSDWLFDRARPLLGRRVLDVGAGLGTFTGLAAAAGHTVVALEPQTEFAQFLVERFADDRRVEVVHGTIDSVTARNFDSIICFNVLEHIHDDLAAARAFAERLDRSGRLFLLVPAHPALYGSYDRAAGHVRRYARRPLGELLTAAGFEIETLRHVNPVGAVGWLARVRFRSNAEWPSGSFGAFDRLVPILRPLDHLRLPFGLSLWAVCRVANRAATPTR